MSASVDTTGMGPPIRGPAALSGDFRRFVVLTRTLAVMEFRVRFFGSALGYFWQLFRPLLLFGILFVIFTEFVKINAGVKYFPGLLLTGIVLFTFFGDATASAVASVSDRESLVRKVQFPRLVVPLAVVLTAGFNLGLNLVAVLVFVLITGVGPAFTWLLLPLVFLALIGFATGVAMLLSALYPRFRDLAPIWEVLLQVLFYGSPILYAIQIIPSEKLQRVIMMNPLAALIQQTRHWLTDTAPSAASAAGGAVWLLIPAAIVVGVVALGYWVFSREAPRIAEEL
jgi:ABC-2 type transport system permease protein